MLQPDVMVYLYAPIEVLLGRIEKRGRPFEEDFDAAYLSDLCLAYQKFYAHYDKTPLLRLDNSNLNYADGPEAEAVLDHIVEDVLRLAGRGPGSPRSIEASGARDV